MENRIRFKIGEIEFEAEGSAEIIERERDVFMSTLLPSAVNAIVRTRGTNSSVQYIETEDTPSLMEVASEESSATKNIEVLVKDIDLSRTSLSSYLSQQGNISEQEFVLFAVYYNEKKNKIKSFSSEVVKQYYSDARRTKYSNISDLLLKLTQKGLIMDDPNAEKAKPKLYILTDEGIKYVENYQPKYEPEKKVSKPKKVRVKEKSEYDGVNIDDLNLQKYPEIKSLSGFKEKMIMIIYIITNEKVGVWFNTSDILYLMTDVFGEAATNDQINGVFKREKLWFKVEKVEGKKNNVKRKLLNQGIDFAKKLIRNNNM